MKDFLFKIYIGSFSMPWTVALPHTVKSRPSRLRLISEPPFLIGSGFTCTMPHIRHQRFLPVRPKGRLYESPVRPRFDLTSRVLSWDDSWRYQTGDSATARLALECHWCRGQPIHTI